jgi:hypothetical protein
MNHIVSDNAISTHPLSAEEKSKARAEELINIAQGSVHTSSTYIMIEKGETEFVLDSKASLLTLYANQTVYELQGKASKPPTKAQIWLTSPKRREFFKIDFNPQKEGHYGKTYNIWKGFPVKAKKGDCSLFWEHVRNIICSGEEAHYIYVRKWLARLIQFPWLIDTSLVLRGKQGTGKGIFVSAIGKLFGPYYAPLASIEKIIGRFNAHLKNALLIYADEAIWDGRKGQEGLLKSLITEKTIFIEAKGRDGYWINNYKHLIVSSNETQAVHLDPDDRRFFVLDVSDARKEDLRYFNKIQKQLESGGYEALMYDLQNEDLRDFDPRVMPDNFSGFDMKLDGAPSIDRFIYTSLKESCWDHANFSPSESLQDLRIDHFYDNYKNWCDYEHQKIMPKEQVGKRLRIIIPEVEAKKAPRAEDPKRRVKYFFPSLEDCRSSFEKTYKQSPAIWEWS